jgi:hypothetical protein
VKGSEAGSPPEVETQAGTAGLTGLRQARQGDAAPPAELASFWEALWRKAAKAERIVGGPAVLDWLWDGEQLWFVRLGRIVAEDARWTARADSERRLWRAALSWLGWGSRRAQGNEFRMGGHPGQR